VKHRVVLVITGLTLALSLVASLGVASARSARSAPEAKAAPTAAAATMPAPTVPNAKAIKAKYGGQSITFIGDSVGGGHVRDLALAKRFTKDTGVKVKVVPHPKESDASYQQIARIFASKSSSFDVAMIDAIWPGAFAPYLVDLKPKLGSTAKNFAPGAIQNDTVDGKLVLMPWFGDFGMLYYRTDLLKKYGYKAPPTTWQQLFSMAKKIQDGEQKSNKNFYGFVFQGSSYEGLTCNAIEWIASSGGGQFIDNGKVTIDNDKASAILDLIRQNIGKTTPRGVTSYTEGESHTAFVTGQAAFMRNWPYAYSIAADKSQSKIVGKFNIAPLPHGPGGKSVAVVGGWQLGVNKYSKHVDASIEFVRYVTSKAVNKFDTITNSNVPAVTSLSKDTAFVNKYAPYLKPATAGVPRVVRPSRFLGAKYNEGSKDIYQGISQILNGTPAKNVLPSIESKLDRIVK
jgi:trehalose/maltose transport system substrate-binding protein